MKKILLLASMLLLGCNDIDGQMQVHKDFEVTDKKGKTVVLEAGFYEVEIEASERKRRVKLEIDNEPKDIKVYFNYDESVVLPRRNGPISIPASASDQNVDVEGELQTDVQRSRVRRIQESCSEQVRVRHCWRERLPDGRIVRRCGWDWRTVRGWREVEYRDVQTTTVVELDLLKPNSDVVLASFNGDRVVTEREYLYEGYCRVNRRYP